MVFDLEFNQVFNFSKENPRAANLRCPFEIIHIGAVKLNENFNEIGKFERLVKPKIYSRIHPYVKKMTGITRENLKNAQSFKSVYRDLSEFISDVDVLCVWGTCDIKELLRNIEYHKLDTSVIPKKYIDVQRQTDSYLKHPRGINISLGNAVEEFNIPLGLKFHNAFNDAFYTAEVLKKLDSRYTKPEIYNPHKSIEGNRRPAADTGRLIKQFEKIFYREMSSEEQSIIRLAYKMGAAGQFHKQ
jgi:DNA polymerase III, epsilon subunit and related 3''-5'' exonucleases